MPGGNGMGPNGAGPMTGRGAGYCAGYGVPGYMNPGPGRGLGFGFGRGRAWGRGGGFGRGRAWGRGAFFGPGAYAPWGASPAAWPVPQAPWAAYAGPDAAQELAALRQQAEAMNGGLEQIRSRIAELEAKDRPAGSQD